MFTRASEEIRGGDAGLLTKATKMLAYAREDAISEGFWPVARGILVRAGHPGEFDDWGRVKAIYDYLRDFDFVVSPPLATQYLLRPEALAVRAMGDCTAMACFVAACAGIYGYPSDLIFDSTRPDGAIEHVWTRVWTPARSRQRYIDCDPTYRKSDARLGWSLPEAVLTRRIAVEVM